MTDTPERVIVPLDDPDWQPPGYRPGPDDPGDIDDECGAPPIDVVPEEPR